MTSVFVSYSRKDKVVANYLANEMRSLGASVFIDYQKLVAGENFISRLGHEIEHADFFVILLSPASVSSKWVQRELAWAVNCDKPIIPIEIAPCNMTNVFMLVNIEKIDFSRW